MADPRQEHLLSPLFHAVKGHLFLKAEDEAHVQRVLLIKGEVVGELFPNVLVSCHGLEEGKGLELPPVPRAPALAVADPPARNNPPPCRLHLSFLDEVHPSYY